MTSSFACTCLALAICLGAGCSTSPEWDKPWTLEDLAIDVSEGSREASFTNTRSGFFYTESNARHQSSWQGWHVSSVKILSDYMIEWDGVPVDRGATAKTRVFPHELVRTYPGGEQETFTFLDSVDAFILTLEYLRGSSAGLSLLFDMSARFEDASRRDDRTLIVSPFSSTLRTERPDVPGWIGILADGNDPAVKDTITSTDAALLRGRVRQSVTGGTARFFVAAASSPEATRTLLATIAENAETLRRARVSRMENLLNDSYVRTSSARFDKALAWAKLSMDALIMEQGRMGIFAGLPWFSNYWGRDTFISLPGATLVTGRFSDAREILQSFARWQNIDPGSPNEGRVPNIVTPTSIAYNTTDGTPWFVHGVYAYVLSSGDTAFAREIYPVVRRAAEGPLRHRTDAEGFLTHEDAETWMDAAGPEGPWSPRGNRANDIQALWHRQLRMSSEIASMLGHAADAERWALAAEGVSHAFRHKFLSEEDSLIFDHLNASGIPDRSVRPNQLYALDLIPDERTRAMVFARLTRELVYPYGVGSLSPHDENFHPFHHIEPLYVQDAAYHNGIVWTWQNGAWIEHAVRFTLTDLSYVVADQMVHQILERGAAGTISELLDAAPRNGEREPRLSGTFTQAWSLAEFIRVTYESYFGVEVDAIDRQVWLRPRLPKDLHQAAFCVPVGDDRLHVTYQGPGQIILQLDEARGEMSVNVSWLFPDRTERTTNVVVNPGESITLIMTRDAATATDETGSRRDADTQVRMIPMQESLENLSLALPLLRPDLRSLAGPGYAIIPHSIIKDKIRGRQTVIDVPDPEGDDAGAGTYSYPSTPHLRKGSLDLRRFTVARGDSLTEFSLSFTSLSNPMWHPEYGFQLTFIAIAIDTEPGGGKGTIGRNAHYSIRSGREYERIIFIGGGVQVEDASGNVMGAYMPGPGDVDNPLGDASRSIVSFAVPSRLLGTNHTRWRYTVLVGAQDDHGGAGLGEFRSVERDGGEWIGGGKQRAGDPNVYDTLEYP